MEKQKKLMIVSDAMNGVILVIALCLGKIGISFNNMLLIYGLLLIIVKDIAMYRIGCPLGKYGFRGWIIKVGLILSLAIVETITGRFVVP